MGNKFPLIQNTHNEVLDKKPKTTKKKKHYNSHQTVVYSKQNHQPNPVINNFPENNNHFWQQRTVQ